MPIDQRIAQQTRYEILTLLSDDEASAVAMAEARSRVPEGDEYLDLEHLEQGVQLAEGDTPARHTLPRSAVRAETWDKILNLLETPVQPVMPT